jgi:nucleoside-diphosphate-sugar epimerase
MNDFVSRAPGFYRDKRVLVTGGLGFIGSALTLALEREGARVRVVDSMVPGCGANHHNLAGAGAGVDVIECDIADQLHVPRALRGIDLIFNLAGEISHNGSMANPLRDLELNVVSQLRFLQTCCSVCPGVRVVYTSTRQEYGTPQYLPVDESHPIQPPDYNGVHKSTTSQYHLLLTRLGKLDCAVLKLTNIYGPRMALDASSQGFMAAFLRNALKGEQIRVFGDGSQLRDPVFVDDVVDCLLRAGQAGALGHRMINVGNPAANSVLEIASVLSRLAALPAPVLAPFPEGRKAIDIGSFSSCTRLAKDGLGWEASTGLANGLAASLEYFRRFRHFYLPQARQRAVNL